MDLSSNLFNLPAQNEYRCQIIDYTASFSMLCISILIHKQQKFLIFTGVAYISLPMIWYGANFFERDEAYKINIIDKIDALKHISDKTMLKAFGEQHNRENIIIIAHKGLLSDKQPSFLTKSSDK